MSATAFKCHLLSLAVCDCHHFAFIVAGQQIVKYGQQPCNKNTQKSAFGQQKSEVLFM
jgi:hypothetical protein